MPLFQGQAVPPQQRIQHQHQAIIPTFKFNCCGVITAWGVALNPLDHKYNVDLQVWRPSPTATRSDSACYSLVDNFYATSSDLPSNRLVTVSLSPTNYINFQPGDVLGVYVESHMGDSNHDNGVILGNGMSGNTVWYGSVTRQGLALQSDTCPYPIGTNGILSSSTQAVPILSIATSIHVCPQSSSILAASINSQTSSVLFTTSSLVSMSSSAKSMVNSYSTTSLVTTKSVTLSSSTVTYSLTSPVATVVPLNTNINTPVILGISIVVLTVCVVIMFLIIVIIIVGKKFIKSADVVIDNVDNTMAFSNQVYGE